MGTACLRASSRKAAPAERLRSDDGADHVAINVDIAVGQALRDARNGFVDAGMDAEGERGAVRRNVAEQLIEFACPPSDDVQDRAKDFLLQFPRAAEFDNSGGNIRAAFGER